MDEVLRALKSSTKMGAGCHVNCTYRIVMMYVQLVEPDLLFVYVSLRNFLYLK